MNAACRRGEGIQRGGTDDLRRAVIPTFQINFLPDFSPAIQSNFRCRRFKAASRDRPSRAGQTFTGLSGRCERRNPARALGRQSAKRPGLARLVRSSIPPARFPAPRAAGDRRAHAQPGCRPPSGRPGCALLFEGPSKPGGRRQNKWTAGESRRSRVAACGHPASSVTAKPAAAVQATGHEGSLHSREHLRQHRSDAPGCSSR